MFLMGFTGFAWAQDIKAMKQEAYDCAMKRDFDCAVDDFNQALVLNPKDPLTRLALAEIYLKTTFYSKSAKEIEKARHLYQMNADVKGLALAEEVEEKLLQERKDRVYAQHPEYINIERVLLDIGYSKDNAEDLALSLLPLYEKMSFRDINDPVLLQEDLKQNVSIIADEVWDFEGGQAVINPRYIYNYALLLNDNRHEKFLEKIGGDYRNLKGEDKEIFYGAFKCSYHSYLGWILLTAHGLKFVPIDTVISESALFEDGNDQTWLTNFFSKHRKKYEAREGHAALAVKITDNEYVFVDFVNSFVTKSFTSEDYTCNEILNYCEFWLDRNKKAYTHIHFLDKTYFRAVMHDYLAEFYEAFHQDTNTLNALNEAIALAPNYYYPYMQLGKYYYNKGRFDEAIDALREGYILSPDNDFIPYMMAKAYIDKKDDDNGIKYLNQAIVNYPDAEYYYDLGLAMVRRKDYLSSIDSFQKVADILPDDSNAKTALGNAYALLGQQFLDDQGDVSNARQYFEKALVIFEKLQDAKMIGELQKALQRVAVYP